MDLGSMLRVMIRRWYASVPGLIMAIALPLAAWSAVPVKYESTSTISLLNSSEASSADHRTGNPFSAFDNSLTPASDYLARTLSSDETGQAMAAQGVTDQTSAVLAPNAAGPFLALTVTGAQPDRVVGELKIFDQYAIDKLASFQRGAAPTLPASSLLRAVIVVPPQLPTASKKKKMEDVAGAAAAGLAVLFLASFGAEALALRRARGRTVEAGAANPAPRRRGPATRMRASRHSSPDTSDPLPAVAPGTDPSGPRDVDVDVDVEDEAEPPWIDIEPLSRENLAVVDRESSSR